MQQWLLLLLGQIEIMSISRPEHCAEAKNFQAWGDWFSYKEPCSLSYDIFHINYTEIKI